MWDSCEITLFWNSLSLANTSGIKRFELGGDDTDAKADANASELKRFDCEEVEGGGWDVEVLVEAASDEGFGASKFCKALKNSLRI